MIAELMNEDVVVVVVVVGVICAIGLVLVLVFDRVELIIVGV